MNAIIVRIPPVHLWLQAYELLRLRPIVVHYAALELARIRLSYAIGLRIEDIEESTRGWDIERIESATEPFIGRRLVWPKTPVVHPNCSSFVSYWGLAF